MPRSFWGSPLCLCWGVGSVTASVLCVTLPSRGPVPSVPREPRPKLQRERGSGEKADARPRLGVAGSPSAAGSSPGPWKADLAPLLTLSHCRQPFCFPDALCLGTLPQNMQYVWVTRPTPTPGQPRDPQGYGCHGLPSAPLPICLHTENGA